MAQPLELEGTWEEIVAQSAHLTGRRVRVTVLPSDGLSGDNGEVPRGESAVPDEGWRSILEEAELPAELRAWLDSLPKVPEEDADALWEAIAEDRRMRRSLPEKEVW